MARTFTTLFEYDGDVYTAVISQLDGHVNIYVPNESLHHLLPDGKAKFSLEEGLKIDWPKQSPGQQLLINILTSLEQDRRPEFKNPEET